MTLQEIFDKAVAAVLEQGHRSLDTTNGWSCRYRGAGGAKCAVGHLISDEYYNSELEGSNMSSDDVRAAVVLSLGCELPSPFGWTVLAGLQRAHDRADDSNFASSFKLEAQTVSVGYGLQWNFE